MRTVSPRVRVSQFLRYDIIILIFHRVPVVRFRFRVLKFFFSAECARRSNPPVRRVLCVSRFVCRPVVPPHMSNDRRTPNARRLHRGAV